MIAVRRVAFLLPSLKFGGAERVAINLARAFKDKGVEVDFLLMSYQGQFLSEAIKEFRVIDLQCNRTWILPLKLAAYLLRSKPDALISSFWKLNLCACLARAITPRVKLALWEHCPPASVSPVWLYFTSASLIYQLSTCVICVSSGVQRDLVRHTFALKRKLLFIFNPIPPPEAPAEPDLISSNCKKILWVGRLETEKNPGLILQALALLPRNCGYVLQIMGDGSLSQTLKSDATALGLDQDVQFLGFQRDPYRFMKDAALLVVTSDSEGLPTVVIEALYSGLAVVSTDCGPGIHDILEGQRYGSVVPRGDPQALAAAIEHEFALPRRREQQRLGASRFAPGYISDLFLSAMRLPHASV